MTILNDNEIRKLCERNYPMISHFYPMQYNYDSLEDERLISKGLSSAGYDIALNPVFKKAKADAIIDPKRIKGEEYIEFIKRGPVILDPGEMVLGSSEEHFNIPNNIMGICVGKSTYARCGVLVNVTPLEPGWKGKLTLEISNVGQNPVRIYPHEGIAQIIFHKMTGPAEVSYAARDGKYQHQTGVTLPRF